MRRARTYTVEQDEKQNNKQAVAVAATAGAARQKHDAIFSRCTRICYINNHIPNQQ